jgi:hypothetical protein
VSRQTIQTTARERKKRIYSSMKGNHISQSLVTEGSLLGRELYRRGFCVYVGITGFISLLLLLLLQEELKDICYVCCADCCVSIKLTVISTAELEADIRNTSKFS